MPVRPCKRSLSLPQRKRSLPISRTHAKAGAPTALRLQSVQDKGAETHRARAPDQSQGRPNSSETLTSAKDARRCVGQSLAERENLSVGIHHSQVRRHVFWRRGSRRFPIERVAGPNVPKEMIKDAVAVALQTLTATDLPARVEDEVRAITKGVQS